VVPDCIVANVSEEGSTSRSRDFSSLFRNSEPWELAALPGIVCVNTLLVSWLAESYCVSSAAQYGMAERFLSDWAAHLGMCTLTKDKRLDLITETC
jgi:hypothetical protein